jgi:thioredoxin reductase
MSPREAKTVAVIGAGPVGLAAAAHLLDRGITPIVLEAGPKPASSMREWSHVRLFSPWRYNIDKAAKALLAPTGWNSPDPDTYPTAAEMLEQYLEPLAMRTALAAHIRTSARVTGISRVGFDKIKSPGREAAPFEIRYRSGEGVQSILTDAVIDASGTWRSPNPAGANGLPALGEPNAAAKISYGMPDVLGRDRARFEGRTVAVLGAGHSAAGSLIDLAALAAKSPATRIVWILRGTDPGKSYGGGRNDQLSARGALGSDLARIVADGKIELEAGFQVSHISETPDGLKIGTASFAYARHRIVDELIVATGFRPDLAFLGEMRLALDPALDCPPILAPLIDPNVHSCGTVRPHGAEELAHPEPGLYVAGIKSYGRAPTFLMATGYEQVRSIAAHIAGDKQAALRVELELPETGVCSVSRSNDTASASRCGQTLIVNASSCGTASEKAKDTSCCTKAADKDSVPA